MNIWPKTILENSNTTTFLNLNFLNTTKHIMNTCTITAFMRAHIIYEVHVLRKILVFHFDKLIHFEFMTTCFKTNRLVTYVTHGLSI